MSIPSLLRSAELDALAAIELHGNVLDLGGVKDSSYLRVFKGDFAVTTVNIDAKAAPDIMCDLERPLPVGDGTYDHALLINVLEHVFGHKALLQETARVLKPGGSAVIVIPFLFPVHPSPEDYHRLTESALRRELQVVGFKDIRVTPLGAGVFSAQYLLIDRLLPSILRFIAYYTIRYAVLTLDAVFSATACASGRRYQPSDYALGFCAVARK